MNHDKEFYEEIMMRSCALQGFYGRFYHLQYMQADEEQQNEFVAALDAAGVETLLDYIMFMEA